MADITFDAKDLEKGLERAQEKMKEVAKRALSIVTDEVMRLSTREVPHDTGALQNTLGREPEGEDGYIVGYNKVYAARLHEHPEYHFQKGRKGKYLSDPIQNNLSIFEKFMQAELAGSF